MMDTQEHKDVSSKFPEKKHPTLYIPSGCRLFIFSFPDTLYMNKQMADSYFNAMTITRQVCLTKIDI